jgi:hypothetical protein
MKLSVKATLSHLTSSVSSSLLISVIFAIYKKRFIEILLVILFAAGLFFINSIMFLEENNTYMHYELYFYMISSFDISFI